MAIEPNPNAVEKNKVKQLQRYLRKISTNDTGITPLTIDGIYSDKTTNSVKQFQQNNSLDVTGETDELTWNRIYEEYVKAMEIQAEPLRIVGYTRKDEINEEMRDISIFFIQTMIKSISRRYANINDVDVNGNIDDKTQNAMNVIALSSGLENGIFSKRLYDATTRLHNALY